MKRRGFLGSLFAIPAAAVAAKAIASGERPLKISDFVEVRENITLNADTGAVELRELYVGDNLHSVYDPGHSHTLRAEDCPGHTHSIIDPGHSHYLAPWTPSKALDAHIGDIVTIDGQRYRLAAKG